MSSETELVILNFNEVITKPSTTIIFTDSNEVTVEKYIGLDLIIDEIINGAKAGDVTCQELLKQITITKFNSGELDGLLNLNAVIT